MREADISLKASECNEAYKNLALARNDESKAKDVFDSFKASENVHSPVTEEYRMTHMLEIAGTPDGLQAIRRFAEIEAEWNKKAEAYNDSVRRSRECKQKVEDRYRLLVECLMGKL